jgi:hypothetical protein
LVGSKEIPCQLCVRVIRLRYLVYRVLCVRDTLSLTRRRHQGTELIQNANIFLFVGEVIQRLKRCKQARGRSGARGTGNDAPTGSNLVSTLPYRIFVPALANRLGSPTGTSRSPRISKDSCDCNSLHSGEQLCPFIDTNVSIKLYEHFAPIDKAKI